MLLKRYRRCFISTMINSGWFHAVVSVSGLPHHLWREPPAPSPNSGSVELRSFAGNPDTSGLLQLREIHKHTSHANTRIHTFTYGPLPGPTNLYHNYRGMQVLLAAEGIYEFHIKYTVSEDIDEVSKEYTVTEDKEDFSIEYTVTEKSKMILVHQVMILNG